MPYLRSVYDGPYRSLERGKPFCSHSPRFRWVVKWKWRDFFRRVKENMAPLVGRPETELGEILSVKIANRDRSGRARTVEVKTAKGRYEVKRVAIRELFKTPTGSLRSTAFHLQVKGDWVVAEGSGFGHGVGLCQWGAMGMARRGYGYREILRHYYRGVELRRIY